MSLSTPSLSATARKASGAHYTPEPLARFLAAQILNAFHDDTGASTFRCLDPAAGDGRLLQALRDEARRRGYPRIDLHGFDTNPDAIATARERLRVATSEASPMLHCEDFLEAALRMRSGGAESFDIVIANPPYVRTQVMGGEAARRLAGEFRLSGRVDLAHAFIQGITWALRPGGIAGIIVSNRFMTTRSGAAIRAGIREEFDILHLWDLGDTRLFAAAVLPAVLLVRKREGERGREGEAGERGREGDWGEGEPEGVPGVSGAPFTRIYAVDGREAEMVCDSVIDALDESGVVEVTGGGRYLVEQGTLDIRGASDAVWRMATDEVDRWLATVHAHTHIRFGDVGRVRVGVKSTADKVFIRSDWDALPEKDRPELLLPLTTHHRARRFRAADGERSFAILYPHEVHHGRRRPVRLDDFPKSARYLERHRETLEARGYIARAGRKWYEIWVPQDPALWSRPKVVFRDIAETPTFWMDLDGSVVNGDCYWIVAADPNRIDLLWLLLAVANSTFIERYYDHQFNNRLYAGRRRFITQYVESFPLPDPASELSAKLIAIARKVYELAPSSGTEMLEKELDMLVWRAFGVCHEG